jgi:hypothetical protein
MISLNTLRILLYITGFCIALLSGYFSIIGLSNIFGNYYEILLLAGLLELSKVVSVSFISNDYFKTINNKLRIFIITSTIILALLTSIGVYGFLTHKYQSTQNKLNIDNITKIDLTNNQTKYKLLIKELTIQNNTYDKNINNLSNIQNSTLNVSSKFASKKNINNLLKTISKNNNNTFQQVDNYNKLKESNILLINKYNDSLNIISSKILQLDIKINSNSDISTLKFISNVVNTDMNNIANILIIIIVIVFDPLAISLLISANKIKNIEKDKKIFGKFSEYTYI